MIISQIIALGLLTGASSAPEPTPVRIVGITVYCPFKVSVSMYCSFKISVDLYS